MWFENYKNYSYKPEKIWKQQVTYVMSDNLAKIFLNDCDIT